MTLKELTDELSETMAGAGIEAADAEAGYFVADAAGIGDAELILDGQRQATEDIVHRARGFAERRCTHEPWQYIVGHAPFRDLDLQVGPGCLIPRPETEYMLDYVLKGLPRGGKVCELGTGSGAISLAIASERPDTHVTGVELSPDALRWARSNLTKLGLGNVLLLQGDLFEPVATDARFDLIVANLPYIPEGERDTLPRNVVDYEPEMALFAGIDGLDVIARAIKKAPQHLNATGRIIFELDPNHAGHAAELMEQTGAYTDIRILPDQYGRERFLTARAPAE